MNDDDARIIRAQRSDDNPYFLCRRDTAQDDSLSWEALGVLTYLLSKPDDWEIKVSDLIKRSGKTKVYRILKELIKARYLKPRTKYRDEANHWQWTPYILHESPYPRNQDTGNGEIKALSTEGQIRDKDKSTPLPPDGGMVTEAHAPLPESRQPQKRPFEEAELVAMKYAVCKHLKAFGKPGKQVAMLLLNLHKGRSAQYNVGGEPFAPVDLELFGVWWDRGHWDKQTRKPLIRPRNMGSVQSYFLMWRDAVAEQARIAAEPDPVYEDLGPVDIYKESIFDRPEPKRNEVTR